MRTPPAFVATLALLASAPLARAQAPAPPAPAPQQQPGTTPPPAPPGAPPQSQPQPPNAQQPLPPLPATTTLPAEQPPPPPPGTPPPYAYPPGYYPPPGYGYAYPPGAYAPPPPPGPPPGHHLHDGFFLRMGLGAGAFSDKSKVDGVSGDATMKGTAMIVDLSIGGTLGSGFILAGAIVGQSVQRMTLEAGGKSTTLDDTSANLSTLGLLGDWYFDPTGGLHAGALIGISTLSMKLDSGSDSARVGSGVAFAPHVGYEGWVGSDWAIGGMFRLTYASLSRTDDTFKRHDTVLIPTLSFTATYN